MSKKGRLLCSLWVVMADVLEHFYPSQPRQDWGKYKKDTKATTKTFCPILKQVSWVANCTKVYVRSVPLLRRATSIHESRAVNDAKWSKAGSSSLANELCKLNLHHLMATLLNLMHLGYCEVIVRILHLAGAKYLIWRFNICNLLVFKLPGYDVQSKHR